MRILLVTEDIPAAIVGGAGQHAVVLGNALIDAGHEVHLLGYQRPPGVDGNCGFRGPLHTSIDFSRARWQDGRFGFFNPLARPHMARRIWRAIRELGGAWDVVHYHGHNPLLGTLVPRSWNFVHTVHDQGAECIIKTRLRGGQVCTETLARSCADCATPKPNGVQRWLSERAVVALRRGSLASFSLHRAVFVSTFLQRRYFAALGVDPADIQSEVIHHFIDGKALKQAQLGSEVSTKCDPDQLSVLIAARIDAGKGVGNFLDAIDDTFLARATVTVCGDGPYLARLEEKHVHRGVRFIGWQPHDKVLALTKSADVCVIPSVWEEAFGGTTVEALSLGRTVYALRRGATPELQVYAAPGQLRLFGSMEEMARALGSFEIVDWPMHTRAVVENRLGALLRNYSRKTAASAEVIP